MGTQQMTGESTFQSLTDHFLIALPELAGSTFADSVIYLCDHSPEGAMGLIINIPLDIPREQVFDQLEIASDEQAKSGLVYYGGPVSIDHGFILHSRSLQNWESTLNITEQVSLTTSKDIIVDIAQGKGPQKAMMILGYAGWGPGQLEQELLQNVWLTVPAEPELLFEAPRSECANLAAAKAGIDLSRITPHSGHA